MIKLAASLIGYITDHRIWSLSTFGKGKRTEGICKHIEKELDEIRANPTDIYEWVDVIILGIDGAWRAGHTPEQLVDALVEKQRINIERQWPSVPEDRPSEHIKNCKPLSGE